MEGNWAVGVSMILAALGIGILMYGAAEYDRMARKK